MGRPKPKFVCNDCNTVFNRKPNVQQQTCWNCGSTNTQPAAKKDTESQGAEPKVVAATPTIPTPPVPPKFNAPKVVAKGVGITPDVLAAQRKKLKSYKRPPVTIPGPKASDIPRGIRAIAATVKATTIMNVRLGVLSKMKEFPGFFYQAPAIEDVSRELGYIAEGKVNRAHANFNTEYRNLGMELPTGLKFRGPRHPLEGEETYYIEYGWQQMINPGANWYEQGTGGFTQVSKACQKALEGYWKARGSTVNVHRLIVAETGEVFYTADHYLSFFRYSHRFLAWYAYTSDEKYRGRGAEWDESFYNDPEGVA
jgi:hypothetical protein